MVQQVLRGTPAIVSVQLADQEGNPRPSLGPVTLTVARADGTTLFADVPAVDDANGTVRFAFTPADTADLDILHLTWDEQGGSIVNSTVEIVGGFLFSIPEARASSPRLRDTDKLTDAQLIAARRAVTEECEKITGRSFVPRYKRVRLSGRYSPHVRVPDFDVRTVRSLTVDGKAEAGSISGGILRFNSGGIFNYGEQNIEVAYEYGLDAPPERIKEAALLRLQSQAFLTRTGVPDRAEYQIIEGRVFSLNRLRGGLTGIKDVDDAYLEWAVKGRGVGTVPVL